MIARRKLLIGALVTLCGLALIGCFKKEEGRVENITDSSPLPLKMTALSGIQGNDRLNARCIFTGDAAWLLMEISVRTENPPSLAFGRYKWQREGRVVEGAVRAESITFLGGQSDTPSLGGRFNLLAAEGQTTHRVILPVSPVKLTK